MKMLGLLTVILALLASGARADEVGFQQLQISNGSDQPLTIGVWYPSRAEGTPTSLPSFMTQTVAVNAPVDGHGCRWWLFLTGKLAHTQATTTPRLRWLTPAS